MQSNKLKNLIETLNSKIKWENAEILDIMIELNICEEDIAQYQRYNHDLEYSYGRNEIYTNKYFRIYLMSWDAGDATAIHDHGNTDWGCVQFIGNATHRTYKVNENVLKMVSKEEISKGAIVSVEGNFIHLMSNLGIESVCTLHIYGNNKPKSDDEVAVIYQPEFGRVVTTSGTAYLNMDKTEIVSEGKLPLMSQPDYQDYLQIITPFYERIGKGELLGL